MEEYKKNKCERVRPLMHKMAKWKEPLQSCGFDDTMTM